MTSLAIGVALIIGCTMTMRFLRTSGSAVAQSEFGSMLAALTLTAGYTAGFCILLAQAIAR